MRIGVVGLYTNENIGDYLLFECCKLLITKHHEDVEIVNIDADPRNFGIYGGKRRFNLKMYRLFTRYRNSAIFQRPIIGYCMSYLRWWFKNNWYYRQRIKNLDGLIISGGGFIKFQTQGLNYLDEQIIHLAKRRNIPVMFNAVGIEGYDENDFRCQRLKKAINSDIVKVITTRDDLDTLRNKYMVNENTVTDLVGDTVFWLQECIDVRKKQGEKAVGINLIRPENYKFYGGKADYSTVENFYKNLIKELSEKQVDFCLFTNGMRPDYKFGHSLIKQMGLPEKTLLKRPINSQEYLEQISQFGVILAARMHAGIVAYAMNIPKVGLIWSEKIQFFSTLIDDRQSYFDENELDAEKIASLLCDVNKLKTNRAKTKKLKDNTLHHLNMFVDSLRN